VDSGGGISPDGIAIPSWQAQAGVINSSNKGSTTRRNGPDVSANADFTFYVCSDQSGCTANSYGGTSFAAPMWAGFIALVNQQLAANGKGPIGFINPTIYNQNVTSAYATNFHDITSGTSGSYSAVTGYDLVTGWGSPKAALISALAGSTSAASFAVSVSPTSGYITRGHSSYATVSTTVSGGFNAAVGLTASGFPAGTTSWSFTPSTIAAPGSGTSRFYIVVHSNAPTGTYPITIKGTGGGQSHTAVLSLQIR
jgi:kumamolisin